MSEEKGNPEWINDLSELIRKKKEENEALKKLHEAFTEPGKENNPERDSEDIIQENETDN